MSPDGLSAQSARALAQEILARPEYARHRRDPTFLQEWVNRLSIWLQEAWDFLTELVPDWLVAGWQALRAGALELLEASLGGDALTVLMRLALAVAVFGTIALLARRILRAIRADSLDSERDEAGAVELGPAWMDDAERYAREGRFLDAAHCAQLASLQLLLRKRCLELERSDPNRTLRRRLVAAPVPDPLRRDFLRLLDLLEGHGFRDREDDSELYGDWRALHARIASLPEAG